MKSPVSFFICFLFLVLLNFSFCYDSGAQKNADKSVSAKFIVNTEKAGSLDIGIGWNEATCLEGRWVREELSPEDWDSYFGLMEWSGCHWLRHAVTITDWEPQNDNDDAQKINWSGFTFDSENMKRHYTFFDQAEKRGIKVLVTNWRLGAKWMTGQDDKWILAHPDDNEEFAETIAAMIYHLKVEKKYQCIWALSLWNEPNGDWAYTGPKSKYPDSFWPLYVAVDKHLRRLGIRNEILLLGPDTSTGGRPEHIMEMLAKYGTILDIICDHDYSAYRGEKMDRSILAYSKLISDLKAIPDKKLPFVIGEFGNYGAGSQAVDDDNKVYDGALSTTAYLFSMLNAGAAGLARWEFHIYSDTWRNFGALTSTDPQYIFKPYGPVYYIHAITARYVKPGWMVYKSGFDKKTDGIYGTVLGSPDGKDLTVLMLNDSNGPVRVTISSGMLLKDKYFHHLSVSGPMPAGIDLHDNLFCDEKGMTITLLPRSVIALTTLPGGDLSVPVRLSLKR
jgi:hypothetical protein